MEACIFNKLLSVLVNGSETCDISEGRGFKEGGSLSPFLFVIAMEGLSALMKKSVVYGVFRGFQINEDLSIEILDFTDDMIRVGEESW